MEKEAAERSKILGQLNLAELRAVRNDFDACLDSANLADLRITFSLSERSKEEAAKIAMIRAIREELDERADVAEGVVNFKFALGMGAIFLSGKTGDVSGGVIVDGNNIVHVTKEERRRLGLWASTNSFFFTTPRLRWGLFAGAQLGGDDNRLLDALAVGISFSTTKTFATDSNPGEAPLVFQIGYGISRIEVLADGLENGASLPANASAQALTKKVNREGIVMMISYAF